jgi:hypothetical protein
MRKENMELRSAAVDTFVMLPASWSVTQALQYIEGLEFTHVIVHRVEPQNDYYYLYTKAQALGVLAQADGQQTIHSSFDLREDAATAVRDARSSADDAPDRTVVLEEGRAVGFFDATDLAYFESLRSMERRLSRGGQPDRFEAYPSLEAPERVAAEAEFEIFIGFRINLDPSLVQSEQMIFDGAEPGEECLVVVIPDGVEIDRYHDSLPLQMNTHVMFTCRAKPDVSEATIKAQYFYRHQLVGIAQRSLTIDRDGAEIDGGASERPFNPCRLTAPDSGSYVDLTVTITHSNDGSLQWTFSAPNPPIETRKPIRTQLQGAREFAANLIRDLETEKHNGPLAANLLEGKGQDIANLMPPEFFEYLRRVQAAINRTPTLLLLTNEQYVPWELAYLDKPLDPNAPRFLASQTHMGRWLDDQNVVLPPTLTIEVRRFTAVAAKSWFDPLPQAKPEQDLLQQQWKAFPLEAKKEALLPILSGVNIPGHLIHFTVHGLSDAAANRQAIRLADNTEITADAITGSYRCGEIPRFAFVFLNACQVGTPGETLGQADGFPGKLVRRGASGFIAPLWEVNDIVAYEFAKNFYEEVLDRKQPVGAALYEQRRKYDSQGSTTPIAYIYYGHPSLRLIYGLN